MSHLRNVLTVYGLGLPIAVWYVVQTAFDVETARNGAEASTRLARWLWANRKGT